jgi:multiple sugar transport system substrate-binding protein
VRDEALRPLDDLFTPAELDGWRAGSAGACYDSYRLAGRQWALPLDAAAQVAVTRPDLAGARPGDWAGAVRLAGTVPTALCLGGPHALLMFCAICLAAGSPPATDGPAFVTGTAGAAALEVMAALLERADRDLSVRNPIAVLDAMAAPGGPAYCPLVYGYISYQRPGPAAGRHRLSFFDAPAGAGQIGSVLGGTGVAITRSCTRPGTAAALIRELLSGPVQTRLFATHGGQSAAVRAWLDPGVDAAGGGFYRATWATVQQAWVRPRFAGYLAFQQAASAVLRAGLLAGAAPGRLVSRVNELFADAVNGGRVRT